MIILPLHQPNVDSYVYVALDCERDDIEDMIAYCHAVCTGPWHHTFNANVVLCDRMGSVHFRTLRDAALFKLRYSEAFDHPLF